MANERFTNRLIGRLRPGIAAWGESNGTVEVLSPATFFARRPDADVVR